MHGIVYVPESEAPSDPLEVEGQSSVVDGRVSDVARG